jgi:transcriptional regulator with PAS, ATPase and Fis domain
MIEYIKTKLWELLRKKEVSLAMIFNRTGDILWHRGRPIVGKTIKEGKGFSKSCLMQCINSFDVLEEEDVVVVSEVKGLPESASLLNIKSIVIQPVSRGFYLYLDSGIKESFSETDREVFKIFGDLLGELIDRIREKQEDIGGISGTSEDIKRIKELVLKYSLEEDPVLLHGETGSGKNHIAGLIHRYSGRKGKFITINTPGIPENLFESEVFGHKKGAFTGTAADKKGLVEEAKGGTLFFDEVAEVPSSFQARLLRFIETRRYFVLGSTEERTADVRIVAATNKDLNQAIKKREFRGDLYFRLQVLEIKIPPLRERKQDIKQLVKEELRYLKGKKIGKGFWEAVECHDWPGNIRELKSVLKRTGILGGDTIMGQDIQNIINQSSFSEPMDERINRTEKIQEAINSGKDFWEAVKMPFLERDINRDQAKEIIRKGLMDVGGRYVDLLPIFNLPSGDYHRFMAFLNDYKLK